MTSSSSHLIAQHWRELRHEGLDAGEKTESCYRRQIAEANKIRSPFVRLPAEIRAIILRMLVGDKLIRVDAREIIVRLQSYL